MKRLKDEFLNTIETKVSLSGKNVLEVGCGKGSRSVQIAKRCTSLNAIDPSSDSISRAREENSADNINYAIGKAESLDFPDNEFDAVIFTLSLHHVPIEKMTTAIDEALRVTKKGGNIIFLEPGVEGNFFEAEISFDACDGDERKEKAAAYSALKTHTGYTSVVELPDETVFQFDSVEDFVESMKPEKNVSGVKDFFGEK
jgi:ubiquinone/menaquinone biosynthesis C-methylase UbiE